MATVTPAQQLTEVKRKASLGIALTDSKNANNNAVYTQTRAATDAEIARKANLGIGLTNTNSDYNNKMYNDLLNAKNASVNAPAANVNGASSFIDGLSQARRDKALADLGKARDNSLSNLGAEKAAIQPKYYDAKNQTAAGSQQQARNFAEFMAARGGTGSGTNAQAELNRGMTLQGNLGTLGRQEAADYSDIERRTSDLQNAYESDVASTNAGIEADSMQAMLNDYYQKQQRELDVAGLTGVFNGQQTLGGKSLNQSILDSNRNYKLNSQNQTFNQNMANKQLERSNFESDRQYDFAVGQQKWENAFQKGQFDFQKGQAAFENAFKNKSFQQSVNDAAASRGLQWASLGQRDKEFVAQEAWNREQFNYTKEQDKIANDLAAQKATSSYDYKSDKSYASQLSETMKDPVGAAAHMKNNAQSYIDKFGVDGYNALRSAASSMIGG
jgi:hypothetical protein